MNENRNWKCLRDAYICGWKRKLDKYSYREKLTLKEQKKYSKAKSHKDYSEGERTERRNWVYLISGNMYTDRVWYREIYMEPCFLNLLNFWIIQVK